MRLEGAANEGDERVKMNREAKWWRSWWWKMAAKRGDLKQAAPIMDLSNIIFSILLFEG